MPSWEKFAILGSECDVGEAYPERYHYRKVSCSLEYGSSLCIREVQDHDVCIGI